MAVSDSASNFSKIDIVYTVLDGAANSLIMACVQSDLAWAIEGQPYTEARTRGQHQSTPVLRKTGDGNVTASCTLLVRSFAGNTAATPYEVLTLSGLAASWVTTAIGDKKALKHRLDITDPSGATQRIEFNYAVAMNVAIDPAGAEGLMSLSFDLTDHENAPTVT